MQKKRCLKEQDALESNFNNQNIEMKEKNNQDQLDRKKSSTHSLKSNILICFAKPSNYYNIVEMVNKREEKMNQFFNNLDGRIN